MIIASFSKNSAYIDENYFENDDFPRDFEESYEICNDFSSKTIKDSEYLEYLDRI